jgi:hypothetical protein
LSSEERDEREEVWDWESPSPGKRCGTPAGGSEGGSKGGEKEEGGGG